MSQLRQREPALSGQPVVRRQNDHEINLSHRLKLEIRGAFDDRQDGIKPS